jgi:O-antigen/teichoic acid export membrane protein
VNFETKYLIRWGIPGWILMMVLGPFLFVIYQANIAKIADTISFLAIGAYLTVIGVPLGYMLNQIHHSLFWVIRKFRFSMKIKRQDGWYDYFRQELKVEKIFYNSETPESLEVAKMKKERYRYLLSRKHELGGVMISLLIASIVILGVMTIEHLYREWWACVYFFVTFFLFILISISRWYSSKNIDKYFEEYLKEADRL